MPSGPVRRPPQELGLSSERRQVEAGRTEGDAAGAAFAGSDRQRSEQGLRRVTLGDAAAIAQALGRSLDELFKHHSAATFELFEDGPASK